LNNIKRNLQNSEKKLSEDYQLQNHTIAPIAPNTSVKVEKRKGTIELLANSEMLINLKYDHLQGEQTLQNMKKMGMLSGSTQAIEQGITTKTEQILCGGKKTNPQLRLTEKEEEFVLSQLIQMNYDRRRGQSVFKSKTGRSNFTNLKTGAPPVGFYEHKFANTGLSLSRDERHSSSVAVSKRGETMKPVE
jgi:hypothetical protein